MEQANANEVLKFEKMTIMKMHAKRMSEIESVLATIQIQKTNSATSSQQQPHILNKKVVRHQSDTFGSN